MALTFVIPFRSRPTAGDWKHVSALACGTIRSALGQSVHTSQVILACRERPAGLTEDSRLTILSEDFPLPEPGKDELKDKYRKIQRALVELRRRPDGHVMLLDADDLVSRRLARWVNSHSSVDAWIFQHGYFHSHGFPLVYRSDDFHLYCGSSAIVRHRADDLPESMDTPKSEIPLLAHGHHRMAEWLRSRDDMVVQDLPFPGTVYRTGHGGNWSDFDFRKSGDRRTRLGRLAGLRPISRRLRCEFGLSDAPS